MAPLTHTLSKPSIKLGWNPQHAYWQIQFVAMANICELLIDTVNQSTAEQLAKALLSEAHRIENKYSRYRANSVVSKINQQAGKAVAIDTETQALLTYAHTAFELSNGAFDITSGVLRKVWNFNSQTLPSSESVRAQLNHIGWQRVILGPHSIQLEPGMQIDLGGIGKEYAVDRCAAIATQRFADTAVLINFGGDISTSAVPRLHAAWKIGIDPLNENDSDEYSIIAQDQEKQSPKNKPAQKYLSQSSSRQQTHLQTKSSDPETPTTIQLHSGAIATSGDTQRFIMDGNVRYGHIVNARTGWPTPGAPASVTVKADNCLQAGTLATLAILKGHAATDFLRQEQVEYWCCADKFGKRR